MESVGDFFRQVRETKGLTLDDVASKTRIHPDFLTALEEGNFSKLPDQVFAKGFVRSYARSLGLDEEDAMRRFDQSAGTFYDKQSETERLRLQQVEDDKRKKANRKVVVAAAAVALLGLVLLLTREQSSVAPTHRVVDPEPVHLAPSALKPRTEPSVPEIVVKPAETDPPTSVPIPAPSDATVPAGEHQATQPPPERPPAATERTRGPLERPTTSLERPATTRSSERPDAVPSIPSNALSQSSAPEIPGDLSSEPVPADGLLSSGGTPLVLDLEATDLSWVVVQVDGASPHEALLRPGERIRWKAHDRFVVTLGNAGGVRVELNGKPQGPFGPAGKVARDIVLKR